MSEELEWEMFEIFESSLFHFPVHDHKSAREIVSYLLRRGVLEEEIAEAIEDSTIDLMIWLNRSGKHMVGEWVISWVNETRDEYLREVEIERLHLEQMSHELTPGRSIATNDSGDTDDFGSQRRLRRIASRKNSKEVVAAGDNVQETVVPDAASGVSGDTDSGVQASEDESAAASPQLTPSRTLRRKWSRKGKQPPSTPHPDPEVSPDNVISNEVAVHHSPTSDIEGGATGSSSPSTMYSSIPSDIHMEVVEQAMVTLVAQPDHNQNRKCTSCTLANRDVFKVDKEGLPVKSLCTCTLAHYSYISQLKHVEENHQEYGDLYRVTNDRALEINIDTLDKDGPGFIFIMTDSLRECMPWSAESRYKVASSRKPERCLLEFRSRNVDIDLIWQVKVEHHIMAVKEVHQTLRRYTLRSNWFRCSLSEIMEAISKVIKKYKHK